MVVLGAGWFSMVPLSRTNAHPPVRLIVLGVVFFCLVRDHRVTPGHRHKPVAELAGKAFGSENPLLTTTEWFVWIK
jgi:hypothetical protein